MLWWGLRVCDIGICGWVKAACVLGGGIVAASGGVCELFLSAAGESTVCVGCLCRLCGFKCMACVLLWSCGC